MPQFDGKIIYSTPQIQTIAFPFSSKKVGMFLKSVCLPYRCLTIGIFVNDSIYTSFDPI